MEKKKQPHELILGMNRRQTLFALSYVKNKGNGSKAAVDAGYSERGARTTASKLLTNPHIADYVKKNLVAAEQIAQVTVADILKEILRLAKADLRTLFDENGAMLPPSKWPTDIALAISGVDVDEIFEGKGDDREQVGVTRKVRLWDKTRALEMCGRYLKMFKDQLEIHHRVPLAERLKEARERMKAKRRKVA